MPRGYAWGVYVSDSGVEFTMRLFAPYFDDPDRGWVAAPNPPPERVPKIFHPRRVLGIDEEGRTATAVVARVDAPLWTAQATTFIFYGRDQQPHTAQIVNRQGEWKPASGHA